MLKALICIHVLVAGIQLVDEEELQVNEPSITLPDVKVHEESLQDLMSKLREI